MGRTDAAKLMLDDDRPFVVSGSDDKTPQFLMTEGRASVFLPPTDDYAGIMAARAAAIAAGGGVVKLKPIRYPSFGNQGVELVNGVSYIGEMPAIVSPNSGAPDIGGIIDSGTILEADGNTPVFYGRIQPGLEFTGTIVNGVLTVETTLVSAQTGVVGFLDAGSNIRQDGVIGAQIFIVAQLTSTEPGGELGKRGTYSVMTTAGQNITNPPAITAGNTWRCEYVSGVTIKNMGFVNAKHGIQLGAFGTQGGSWCHFENLHAYNTTAEPYDLLNFEHISVDGLYSFTCFHGPRLAMWAAAGNGGLGNSVIQKVYNYNTGVRLGRGIVLGAPFGTPGSGAGTLYLTHIQNNHFNRVALDVDFTLTSGNANIAVGAGQVAQFPVDMPIKFASSLGGFTGGAVASGNRPNYFVVAQDIPGGTVQVSLNPRGAAVVPNDSGTVSTRSYGFAAIMMSGGPSGATKANTWGLDMEGQGNVCVLHKVAACAFSEFLFTNLGEEALVLREVSGLTLGSSVDFNLDSQGVNSSLTFLGTGRIRPLSASTGGNNLLGLWQEVGGGLILNLAQNKNSGGQPTLRSREPGNGGVLEIGTAIAFRHGHSPATALSLNQASVQGSTGAYSGVAPAVWTWNPTPGSGFVGIRVVLKNTSLTGGATLTVRLAAAAGTFDGLTGGASLGKDIVLQPGAGSTPGGCLSMICMQTGTSTYAWCVESLLNGAML